ncbi:hypothetical protein BX600DRAFT_2751 [Xylariales sp. PMI_506]|nr:hypothetical protein BX600DRAFT_2751 [Xylariales sp. PMI_506]
MYSRDQTVDAVLKFYQQIIRHPYLDDGALVVPPPEGWDNIRMQGKNEVVIDLLRHLPYLRTESIYDRLCIHYETVPLCYAGNEIEEYVYPLPEHCVYLTHSVDSLGTQLIIDTDRGTLTEYTHNESYVTASPEEYDLLPYREKWKGHRTAPIVEFLDSWVSRYRNLVWMLLPNPIGQPMTGNFYSRAENRRQEEQLLQEGQLQPMNAPRTARGPKARQKKHVADVYNTHLRHGWPDNFDKDQCRADLLELERNNN